MVLQGTLKPWPKHEVDWEFMPVVPEALGSWWNVFKAKTLGIEGDDLGNEECCDYLETDSSISYGGRSPGLLRYARCANPGTNDRACDG